jgi:hypothetical protein
LYEQEKKQFFGLCFSEENITITVLENVTEFMEEGDTLKHCVFTNEYFKKKDSLILSARIDNKPVETVEVSISHLEVIQSMGMKNNPSKHHKQIQNLMHKNFPQIAMRAKKRKLSHTII